MESSESSLSHGTCPLEEFKVKLRMSFRSYVRRPSELHFLSAIQAVERAIVGVQEGCLTNYEICLGSLDGGKVSSIVAAGIDCLELILEFVAGHNRLNMVKRHIQSLVACLFNVTLHLQGPKIFYGYVDSTKDYENPDSGSVILMSIEVLTRISGKKSLFHIDASHIAQSLRIPGALFQNFLHLPIFENAVDQKFSMELYNACCRLLCTVLKHHKRETQQCLALLEDSVSVLLQCLEIVNIDSVTRKDYFAWEVQEAVMCASSLRRVYEEVRQQKDVFGCSSFQFLSRYIWVYCGLGPSRNGIKREIDEALRPGVYALIDSCSTDDLQLLHTLFGEGPCRSTLASLQHDYKLHFQFEGKV
ncbi:Nucleolar 27S pre-rRNA proCES [Forsythia ovata]